MKLVENWCTTGTKTAPSDSRREAGWSAGDRPPGEEWNFLQDEIIGGIRTNTAAAQHALNGSSPTRLLGNTAKEIPIIRPNPFVSLGDQTHLCLDEYHVTYSPDETLILDTAIGWDPSRNLPIFVMSHSSSITATGATSASLALRECWQYDVDMSTVEPEELSVSFGSMEVTKQSYELPILICDGYLYVAVCQNAAYENLWVFRYDLRNWTGIADASLEVTTGSSSWGPGPCTELIEFDNDTLAIVRRTSGLNTINPYIIEKDLTTRTKGSTKTGYSTLERFLRSDGENLFGSGLDSTNGRPYPFWYEQSSDTLTAELTSSSFDDWRIVDMMPSCYPLSYASLSVPPVLCYMYDTTNSSPPCLRWTGFGSWAVTSLKSISFSSSSSDIETSRHGSFCMVGNTLVLSVTKAAAVDTLYCYDTVDLSLLIAIGKDDDYSLRANPQYLSPYLGPSISSTPSTNYFTNKLLFDGRDLWSVEHYNSTLDKGRAHRIVSPLTKKVF